MAEFGPRFFSTHVDSSKMSPHRVIASATARSRLATIVRLSAADRLPARACVYEGLASYCSQGAFTTVDLLAEQQRLDGVCASAERQCLLTSAREATGSQSARCWSHRKASAHYLPAALTNPWLAHRPWHSKHASARYGERQFLVLLWLYTARRLQQFQPLDADAPTIRRVDRSN